MKAKRKVPNIVRGGRAIPVGKDLYLLQGRTHEQGGIDIGKNPRTGIEAEGGEIIQMKPNELRVHSAQPLLNGESPAEKILKGANPDKVFQAQEQFKDRHRIKDDGTKYQKGGNTEANLNNSEVVITPKRGYVLPKLSPLSKEGREYYNKISGQANIVTPEFDIISGGASVGRHAFGSFINLSKDLSKTAIRGIRAGKAIAKDIGQNVIFNSVMSDENNEKRNGGMIEINGNVRNGLIHTPRSTKKCGGRKKARLGTRDYNPATRGGIPVSAMPVTTIDPGLPKGINTWADIGHNLIRELQADDISGIDPNADNTYYQAPDSTYVGRDNRTRYNSVTGRRINRKDNYNEGGINIKNPQVPINYGPSGKLPSYLNRPNMIEDPEAIRRSNAAELTKKFTTPSITLPKAKSNNTNANSNNAASDTSAPSPTGGQVQSNSTSTSSTSGRGSGTNTGTSSNTRGRKTITDAKVSKSWRETVGDDADVLNYIANGDAWEHKNWQDRHSKIIKDSGYDPKSGRAVRNDEVKQYYKDFNDKFHTANRKLALYTTPAGKSGDNQFGEKKRFGGRRKAVAGTSDPYADEYVGSQGWDRKLGPGDRESLQYLQGQIDSRRQSPLRRAAFQRGDGYAGVIDQIATPEFKGLNVAKPNIEDFRPTIKQDVIKANKVAERKRLTARDRFSDGPTTGDWIGAGVNLAGSVGDFIGTNAYLNKMKAPGVRVEAPVKLKTKFNINPQLDATKQAREQAFRDIDANTSSSATGLARKQNVRNNALMTTNQLWGNKENTETQLVNQDKMNLQGVRNRNTTRLNRWEEQKTSINNAKYNAKAANLGNMLGNISGTVNDVIGRVEMRKRDNNTLAAIKAATGNVDDRIFTDAGVNYDPRNRKYINTNKGVVATARYGKRKKLK